MGWYGSPKGTTRRAMIQEVLDEYRPKDNYLAGDELWMICTTTIDGQPQDIIVLCLISQNSGDWGYRPIDEGMGPSYYKVPLEWLDRCPWGETNKYAKAWRAKVREIAKRVS